MSLSENGRDSKIELSIVKQCRLLKIHRGGLYYKKNRKSLENLKIMQLLDQQYFNHTFVAGGDTRSGSKI
jgi:putative transposase